MKTLPPKNTATNAETVSILIGVNCITNKAKSTVETRYPGPLSFH